MKRIFVKTDDIRKKLYEEMLKHKGRANSISAYKLSVMFGLPTEATQSETRRLLKTMAKQYSVPLLADSTGFFIATSLDELQAYNKTIMDRVQGILYNQRIMNENFYKFNCEFNENNG